MKTQIRHYEDDTYIIKVNDEFDVELELQTETFDNDEGLSEENKFDIIEEVWEFHEERLREEADAEERVSNPYGYYGVSRSDFF